MSEEQFGWRVAKHCPDALRILDCEDLHCLRRARQKALKDHRIFLLDELIEEEDAKREIASILRCDLTLVISEYEMRVLSEIFRIDPILLHYLPIFSKPPIDSLPSFENRTGFIFIGNFRHEPNADAVRYMKQTIWPEIRKCLTTAELHIYGAYASPAILGLNNPSENFFVDGRADNASEVTKNARVVLAPLRFGAGIKGKLLEAMQNGTPSITTAIGAEGMSGILPWNGYISDNPQEMARYAARLYTEKSLWQEMQQNGFEILNKRFRSNLFAPDFIDRIDVLLNNLKRHRKNNFLGAMLQFHTMRSTEYLSRWIEEKNRKA